jgi:hypothetical protein
MPLATGSLTFAKTIGIVSVSLISGLGAEPARKNRAAQVGKPRLHLGIGKCGIEGLVLGGMAAAA